MNEHEIHDMLMKHICREIQTIAENIQKSGTMSEKDLERLDMLYHTKKDMLTAKAMMDADEYEGVSGTRGRSPMTGRYMSREGYPPEPMHGNSGHYPMYPNYPYPERNW